MAAWRPAAAERREDAVALRRRHAGQCLRSRCAAQLVTPARSGCAAKSGFQRKAAQRSRRRSFAPRRAAPLRHAEGLCCAEDSWQRLAAHAARSRRARESAGICLASLAAAPCSLAAARAPTYSASLSAPRKPTQADAARASCTHAAVYCAALLWRAAGPQAVGPDGRAPRLSRRLEAAT
jgi:hypothetical protein